MNIDIGSKVKKLRNSKKIDTQGAEREDGPFHRVSVPDGAGDHGYSHGFPFKDR